MHRSAREGGRRLRLMGRRATVAVMLMLAGLLGACAAPMGGRAAGGSGAEVRAAVDPPIPVTLRPVDATELYGHVVGWVDEGFAFQRDDGEVVDLRWDEVSSRDVALVHARVFGRDATAAEELALARRLSRLDDEHADRLLRRTLRRALRQDASLEPEAERILAERQERLSGGGLFGIDRAETRALPAASVDAPAHLAWPHVSRGEHEQVVAQLTSFAEQAGQRLDLPLERHESKHFLFVTDLPADEAAHWLDLLERMYATLLGEFGLPADEHIWRGKALVFVFNEADDYRRFQREVHQTDPSNSIGMCHNFSSGNVHIAFYRSEDRDQFARVMVHEAAHAFVHRYRSRVSVVSWINEGLAEWVAHNLAPDAGTAQNMLLAAREQLQRRESLDGFFEADRIEPWQYGVAYTLTDHMIRRDPAGYFEFIRAVKDGVPWERALQREYGVSVEQLLASYSHTMGVEGVRR